MSNIIDLQQMKDSKKFNPSLEIPFVDMIFDKEKRQSVYDTTC
jgi:hypothetical protein